MQLTRFLRDSNEGANLTGLNKYFNSVTVDGRANVTRLTLGAIGLFILYKTLKPKPKPTAQ